jgi:asparagine synthase (glutamine-hydrolysing)
MCGIAGVFGRMPAADGEATVARMTRTIAHRGPDGSGIWSDPEAGVFLGHRRLSIIDLSPAGAQPMRSIDGRYEIVYNGEIYNFEGLRAELGAPAPGAAWRGHSDTEVMLAAFVRWGVRGALERLEGMFALALWDRERRELVLARDRFGEKPLYFGRVGAVLGFASELKALRPLPGFGALRADPLAAAQVLRYSCIAAPRTIFEGIEQLAPGHLATVRLDDAGTPSWRIEAWWDAIAEAVSRAGRPSTDDDDALVEGFSERLVAATRLRMVSDVPLGAFLSGGIDSTAIVCAMRLAGASRIRTFSVGFAEKAYDESSWARTVAQRLGTEHTEYVASPADALALVPRLGEIWDEPFADSSQIPTLLVSRMARESVTVSLSGDAGDELFGGYYRHQFLPRLARAAGRMPAAASRSLAGGALGAAAGGGIALAAALARLAPERMRPRLLDDKLRKALRTLAAPGFAAAYESVRATGGAPPGTPAPALEAIERALGRTPEAVMLLDTVSYLPSDILTKVDRAAMSVSLETRVPFLDSQLYRFAWSLPGRARIRDGQGKWIVRRFLARHLPQETFQRPKMGFGLPIDRWLRGELRDWAQSLIDALPAELLGPGEAGRLRGEWREHLEGRADHHHGLWNALMLSAWNQAHRDRPCSS